jgi:hypothetical protein
MVDHSQEIATLVAQADVVGVLTKYCRAIDTKDWGLFESCFVDECDTSYQRHIFTGLARLSDVMRRLHDGLDSSLHRLTNVEVSFDGDEATSRSYVDALLVESLHPDGPVHHVAGVYQDRLVRGPQGWKISHRVFEAVWVTKRGALPLPGDEDLKRLLRVAAAD